MVPQADAPETADSEPDVDVLRTQSDGIDLAVTLLRHQPTVTVESELQTNQVNTGCTHHLTAKAQLAPALGITIDTDKLAKLINRFDVPMPQHHAAVHPDISKPRMLDSNEMQTIKQCSML